MLICYFPECDTVIQYDNVEFSFWTEGLFSLVDPFLAIPILANAPREFSLGLWIPHINNACPRIVSFSHTFSFRNLFLCSLHVSHPCRSCSSVFFQRPSQALEVHRLELVGTCHDSKSNLPMARINFNDATKSNHLNMTKMRPDGFEIEQCWSLVQIVESIIRTSQKTMNTLNSNASLAPRHTVWTRSKPEVGKLPCNKTQCLKYARLSWARHECTWHGWQFHCMVWLAVSIVLKWIGLLFKKEDTSQVLFAANMKQWPRVMKYLKTSPQFHYTQCGGGDCKKLEIPLEIAFENKC